jgi:hypothetical protein
MVYLHILCNLILIFDVFEPSKINYQEILSKLLVNTAHLKLKSDN